MNKLIMAALLGATSLVCFLAIPACVLAQQPDQVRTDGGAPKTASAKKSKAAPQIVKKSFSPQKELLKSLAANPAALPDDADLRRPVDQPVKPESKEAQGVELGKGVKLDVARSNAGSRAIGSSMGLERDNGNPGMAPGLGIGVQTSPRSKITGSFGVGVDEGPSLKPGTPEYKSKTPASGPSAGVGLSVSF